MILYTAKITTSDGVDIVKEADKKYFLSKERAVKAAEAMTGLHFEKSASAFMAESEYRAGGVMLTVEDYYIPEPSDIA